MVRELRLRAQLPISIRWTKTSVMIRITTVTFSFAISMLEPHSL